MRLYDSNVVSKQPNGCCKEKEKISLGLFCKKLFLSIIIIGITYILLYILSKHSFIRPSIYTFILQMIYVLMLNPPRHIFLWKKRTYIAKNSKKIPLKRYFKIVLNNKKTGATLIIVAHLANIFLC